MHAAAASCSGGRRIFASRLPVHAAIARALVVVGFTLRGARRWPARRSRARVPAACQVVVGMGAETGDRAAGPVFEAFGESLLRMAPSVVAKGSGAPRAGGDEVHRLGSAREPAAHRNRAPYAVVAASLRSDPAAGFLAGVAIAAGRLRVFLLYTALLGDGLGRLARDGGRLGWVRRVESGGFLGFAIAVVARRARRARRDRSAAFPCSRRHFATQRISTSRCCTTRARC